MRRRLACTVYARNRNLYSYNAFDQGQTAINGSQAQAQDLIARSRGTSTNRLCDPARYTSLHVMNMSGGTEVMQRCLQLYSHQQERPPSHASAR